jgi:Ca2+-binding RTX toxin-like protein
MSWNWCWNWWRGGDDNLTGSSGRNWLFGGRGNDTIDGGGGNDRVWGGRGNDIAYGGAGNDRVYGGRGNDRVYGGDGNDRVYGGRGNDRVYGGDGNDKVKGGSGDDEVDGGAGSDRVYGGRGDDRGNYYLDENRGSKDYYDGGHGNDVLVLHMTRAEFNSDAVQADLAAYDAFLAGNGHGWGHHGHSFKFKAFDLKVKNWESIKVKFTDADSDTKAGSNDPPQANNDTVFANVGTIAEREPNDPAPNIAAGSAQVIARSSFRIGQTKDVDPANALLPRVSIAGSIDPISDVDVYAIDLKANETLLLDIDYGVDFGNPIASVDTQIFVLDANGNVLAENDTSSSLLGGAGSQTGFDPFAFFTATSADTYYVAVTSFNNDPTGSGGGTFDGNGMTSGDYVLNISVQNAEADLGGVLILADTLLANDTDSNGDALVITSVGNAVNGTVDLNGDGDVIFTPTSDFSGSFEYTISDTAGNESTATATVSMNGGDAIVGSAFDDVLIGGAGNDVFTGGDGNDAFAFTPGSGDDAIMDFTIGSDFMVLADGMSVANFVEQGSDTLVNFDSGDSVLLVGVTGVTDANDLFPSG